MKFGYVNSALHSWNIELQVSILAKNPTCLCPNKSYINCRKNQEDSLSFHDDAYSDLKDTEDKTTFSQVCNFFLDKK